MLTDISDTRVLIIEDEPVIRESIAAYLEDSGFAIIQAENGRVGLEKFHAQKPDIILVDLRMPEVDGLDVLTAVNKDSSETPIIVVSGTGVIQDAIEALRLGAWDYITKPIQDMAILEYAVNKALERAKLLRERHKYHQYLKAEIKKRTAQLEERTRELEITNEKLKKEIAEHRRTESYLRQAQKMEAVGTLAGGIAHDFNNILFPIIGYAEMSMDEVEPDSSVHKYLEGIFRSANRAKDLVSQILAFSRKHDAETKPLKIQPVVKESLKLLRSTMPATIDISENIDPSCGAILANPIHIQQIIMNLGANAYHAMRETGGTFCTTLREIKLAKGDLAFYSDMLPGRYLNLTISDTGHGMTREIMEQIFDPYFTTKETGEGTGLGLSVVQGIIRNHGAHIKVYSEAGKGTTFNIYFPMIELQELRTESQNLPETALTGEEKILLVDDEEPIIQMEKHMLERLGYDVTARTSSIEALEAFRTQPKKFNLVITDMSMPNMSGIELSKKLMAIREDIPIILCTGFSEIITEEKAKALGIREFIMKPVLRNEIAKVIRRVLD